MKQLLFMLLILCASSTVFAQKNRLKGYKQFPASFRHRDSMIRYITPDTACTYWEFDMSFGSAKHKKVIFSKGIKPDSVKFEYPGGDMLTECMPGYCNHFIVYIRNGKVGYVNSDRGFRKFIGHIDNVAEAALVAEVYLGLFNYIDSDPRGGSYKLVKNGFDLKLCHYELCPETKSSYHIVVSRDGKVEAKDYEVYYQSKDCVEI